MITTKTLYLQKGPSGKEKDVEVSTYVLKTVWKLPGVPAASRPGHNSVQNQI